MAQNSTKQSQSVNPTIGVGEEGGMRYGLISVKFEENHKELRLQLRVPERQDPNEVNCVLHLENVFGSESSRGFNLDQENINEFLKTVDFDRFEINDYKAAGRSAQKVINDLSLQMVSESTSASVISVLLRAAFLLRDEYGDVLRQGPET